MIFRNYQKDSFIKKILKKIRIFFLLKFKYKFKKVGKGFYCGKNLLVRKNTVSLNNNVFIGNNCHFSIKELVVDDFVMIASNVSFIGGDHKHDIVGTPIIFCGRDERKSVVIEKDVWIGHGSIILHGVRIGEGSIIGAGSVVTKDVEPYAIYVGNPARKLRNRFDSVENAVSHSQQIGGVFHRNKRI